MALVSHQRCYYSNGIGGTPSSSVNQSSSANALKHKMATAAPSIQTAFADTSSSSADDENVLNGNHYAENLNSRQNLNVQRQNFSASSATNKNGQDSAGPSSSSSSSTCSSLLAPNRSAAKRNADSGSAANNSSSGCSSASPVGATNTSQQPDRPIGYGAFGVVWSVTDPRSGKRVALKKMPNVFQNLASCKRVFREIRILSSFKHDNILSCLDVLQPANPNLFQEIYVLTELMQSDLHKIIVSPQALTTDHVKLFLYQILRGVKYLHSANIIHRDIKPGNLLVNSNCVLKICDFGLARIWDPYDHDQMTHEVVTQYYRAPELLMGTRRYTVAIDVWSIGCIFAELLGRRILFQAQSPIDQLNMIIELLGTPTISQMKYACDGARCHVLKSAYRPPNAIRLYSLSSQATHDAIHLLTQMLTFDPDQRISVDQVLAHNYMEDGRLRYHSCMCSCCYSASNADNGNGGNRIYATDLEPRHTQPFDVKWERDMARYSVYDLRDKIHKFITDRPALYNVPLCINPHSAAFKNFTSSSCAQFTDLPPSPQAW